MRNNKYIHTPEDGRGLRDVFVNGKLIDNVVYADTRRNFVRITKTPFKTDRYRKRILLKTIRGKIDIVEK